MKKLGIVAVVLVITIGISGVVADHYRYDLHEAAINFEMDNAGLVKKTGKAYGVEFSYLEGPRAENQETIVMLHGFSADKSNWMRFAKFLQPEYHVIALDLMGHGDNAADLARSYSIVEQVEFVRAAMASLQVERYHLVGNSMGGAISSLFAIEHPKHVLSATLISPAGIHDVPSEMDLLLEKGQNPLIATKPEEFAQVVDFVMEEKPYIPGPVAKVEAEKAASRVEINRKIFKDIREDMKLNLAERMPGIQAPVLIMWGAQDRAINVKNIDKYAELIPNAKKQVYEGIGHLAMIEIPQRSASDMQAFMANL